MRLNTCCARPAGRLTRSHSGSRGRGRIGNDRKDVTRSVASCDHCPATLARQSAKHPLTVTTRSASLTTVDHRQGPDNQDPCDRPFARLADVVRDRREARASISSRRCRDRHALSRLSSQSLSERRFRLRAAKRLCKSRFGRPVLCLEVGAGFPAKATTAAFAQRSRRSNSSSLIGRIR